MTDPVCPYCRMPFDENAPPRIFCTACGMPHHEDCYQENGGCTVFGCPRAPADDPKLQVSYSDLNAVTPTRPQVMPVSPVAPQNATVFPQFPSPYGGPLGLSQPAGAPAQAAAPAQASLSMDQGTPASLTSSAASSGPTLPSYAQALPAQLRPVVTPRQPRSRTTFIVLGVLLGAFGAHNFYAGYTGRAVGQLCLTVLTLLYLGIIAWIWAIVEICIVDRDSAGIQFT